MATSAAAQHSAAEAHIQAARRHAAAEHRRREAAHQRNQGNHDEAKECAAAVNRHSAKGRERTAAAANPSQKTRRTVALAATFRFIERRLTS